MLYVLLSILASGYLIIIFREFARFNLSLLQVITVNYAVCVLCGIFFFEPHFFEIVLLSDTNWLKLSWLQGSLFITIFLLTGFASQNVGAGYTAVVTKISVVIPTLASFLIFKDRMDAKQWIGIACALVAIILIHLHFFKKTGYELRFSKWLLIGLGAVLFIGNGIIDTDFKIFQSFFAIKDLEND